MHPTAVTLPNGDGTWSWLSKGERATLEPGCRVGFGHGKAIGAPAACAWELRWTPPDESSSRGPGEGTSSSSSPPPKRSRGSDEAEQAAAAASEAEQVATSNGVPPSAPPPLGFALTRLDGAWVSAGLVPARANHHTVSLAELLSPAVLEGALELHLHNFLVRRSPPPEEQSRRRRIALAPPRAHVQPTPTSHPRPHSASPPHPSTLLCPCRST